MCKKLFVALVVLALAMPSIAAYIGFNEDGEPDPMANQLRVDIVNGNTPRYTWQGYDAGYAWTGPVGADLVNPLAVDPWEVPHIEVDAYKTAQTPNNNGGSRSRNGGMLFVAGTGEYNATAKMFGMNYLKVTLTGLAPETNYTIKMWGWEARNVWSVNTDNPDSKYGVWCTTNPVDWLTSNGYPNGYAPTEQTDGSSGMPQGLADLVAADGGRFYMIGPEGDMSTNFVGEDVYCTKFTAMTTAGGALTLYGWIDPTDWAGSMHMPLEGFSITPEPATIALLGLGGLALLRRKRA